MAVTLGIAASIYSSYINILNALLSIIYLHIYLIIFVIQLCFKPLVLNFLKHLNSYYYYWWGGTESLGICSSP
jgi:hypothetical protein